ncbi:hypothetical protein Pint_27969 [Pistacia integerrima]|uniref:Uncharacterized protein n=1 Tax=Pistacia integerrima TaxID=434235 RepID=A0ACC0YSC7_9ROSI|nr:hypothetical protein Pint_27969 [Pistacia integerrima]
MKIPYSLFSLVFLFQFLSLGFTSSAYTLPDKFFINCGSQNNMKTDGRREFTGDLNSGSFSFSKQSKTVKDSNQAVEIYQTARVFSQPSFYEFEINNNGTYLVRLHFFAFSSSINLSTAVFDVLTSTSKFLLLENFTVQNPSHSPIVKEFILSIAIGKFKIYFTPQVSSFAFVNAIEVFPGPEKFISDKAGYIRTSGNVSNYTGLLSKLIYPIYRINVGGPTLTQDNDTLWRNWKPDDSYLLNPDAVTNQTYSVKPNYLGEVSEYIAPDFVYQTARELSNSSSSHSNSNINWSFSVSKNAMHFVRLHFCDIVSPSPNVTIFNLYVDGNLIKRIAPYSIVNELAAPFYLDYVVDSDYSGTMNISVGLNNDTDWPTAFLNGLEIMELIAKSGSLPKINEPKKDLVLVVVGSVLGGLALISILAVGILWGLKCRKSKPAEPLEWSPLHIYGAGNSHGKVTEGTINGSPIPYLNLELKIPFAEIQYATNNFNSRLLIGKGGFGYVYKGTFRSGLKVAVKRSEPGSGQADWGMHCKNKGVIEEIVDPSLKGKITPNSLRKFIETAEKCLEEDGVDRPTMGDVLWDLEYALQFEQSSTRREPHEDTTTNSSSVLILPDVKRFPSFSQSINDMPNLTPNSFISSENDVFSQLRIEN